MKSKFLLLLLFFSTLGLKAENITTLLMVWGKDGSKQAVALTDKPKITFTSSDLVVEAKGVVMNYALKNMARFTYEENEVTRVTNLTTGETAFALNEQSLYFPRLEANSRVSVYGLDGVRVLNQKVSVAGEYTFSLSELKPGTYLVNVNGVTSKIIKK